MAYEWRRPNGDRLMNAASLLLAVWATRNEIVGWGPPVANALRDLGEHVGDAIVLGLAVALVLIANGRRVAHLIGFREKAGPRWRDDDEMSDEVMRWMRRRLTVTDTTSEMQAKNKEVDLAFAFTLDRGDKRPVSLLKPRGTDIVQLSARIAPGKNHADTIVGMDEPDYRAMQDDLALELVKSDVVFVSVERVVPERGRATDEDGDPIPSGVFMAGQLTAGTLAEADLVNEINVLRRAIVVTQTVIRKHVRMEDARRGRSTAPVDISSGLSVIAAATDPDNSASPSPPPEPRMSTGRL